MFPLLQAHSFFFFSKCSIYWKIIRISTRFNPFRGNLEINQCSKCCELCLYLFIYFLIWPQDGIKPMWEDDRNRRGGRWLITLSKQQRKSDLDRFWLETVRWDSEQTVLSASHLVPVLITKPFETQWHSRWNKDANDRSWTWASYGFTASRACSRRGQLIVNACSVLVWKELKVICLN